jgi:hypothetical protein
MRIQDITTKELEEACWKNYKQIGMKKKGGKQVPNCVPKESIEQDVAEAPIAATDNPNDPMIYGHEKANSMTLQGRITQARAQLKELAELAETNDLVSWERITKLAKGGMFMGLEQNLEQIRHGIEELSKKRAKGGIQSRGIDKNIG